MVASAVLPTSLGNIRRWVGGEWLESFSDTMMCIPDGLWEVSQVREVPMSVLHFLGPALRVDSQQPVKILCGNIEAGEVEFFRCGEDAYWRGLPVGVPCAVAEEPVQRRRFSR